MKHKSVQMCVVFDMIVMWHLLNDWTILDEGTDIAETNNEEGDALKEEVDIVTPFAMEKIIAPNSEEEYSNSQLQEVHSVTFTKSMLASTIHNWHTI